jgi:hypothetical protein
LVKDVLVKNNVTTLLHPPYSPDISSPDFHLFPGLKSTLNEQRCFEATDIKNATEELKRLSQNGFQECFQRFYSRWQKCIFAQVGHVEGNAAENIVFFCFSEIMGFREHLEATAYVVLLYPPC